ncbi:MAG: hypothetical protein VB140_01710 [Burkholderia sp.]
MCEVAPTRRLEKHPSDAWRVAAKACVMSTVTNCGQVRWKVFEGAMNAGILLDFLKRLIIDHKLWINNFCQENA